MPTYEYRCSEGHTFEKFQKMTERPRAKCPICGKAASRQISGGAGLVFKGSGFYITDYGKDGKGPRKSSGDGAVAAGGGDTGAAKPAPAAGTPAPASPAAPAKSAE